MVKHYDLIQRPSPAYSHTLYNIVMIPFAYYLLIDVVKATAFPSSSSTDK